jgi:Na+-transporting NADH:ubiquinone oxidoreductase subunit F
MGNQILKIVINDNPDLTKETSSGVTLLNALLSNQISVPSPCGGKATCKQCKVVVKEGGGPVLDTDKATFSKRELDTGWRLSCQCKVKNDLKIEIPESLLDVKTYEAEVISNKNVASFIKELVIKIPPGTSFSYKPGCYVQFHVPSYTTNTSDWKETMDKVYIDEWEKYQMFDLPIRYEKDSDPIVRAYSMASFPQEGEILKFNVRIATPQRKMQKKPWGICSSYLFSLQPGDKLSFSGPYGESFMKGAQEELVFLIGGAGSSFGRSHIMHLFETEKTQRKVTLWYGARSLQENIYEEDFKKLSEAYDNFTYHLVLSEPTEEDIKKGWPKEDPVKTNFVFKAFETGQLSEMENPDDVYFFVCGPPLHNLSVMDLLDNYGVPRDHIILDDFGN